MNRVLLLTLLSIGNMNLVLSQDIYGINVMPYEPGTREDSLEKVTERIEALRETGRFYERTYLQKSLVYVPVDSVLYLSVTSKPILLRHEIENGTLPHRKRLMAIYAQQRKYLRKEIKKSKAELKRRNRDTIRELRRSPQAQMDIVRFRGDVNDYEFVFLPSNVFTVINNTNPRENSINQRLDDELKQALLGHATDVESYISSINYVFDVFNQTQHPDLVKNLLNENLKHAIRLVKSADSVFVKGATLNLGDYGSASGKMWINTNKTTKEIYLSPYLIRAVFMMSYYEVRLMKLIENKTKKDVKTFIGGKGRYSSPITIDSAYFKNFVNKFSWNMQFVISHELAHLYTQSALPGRIEFECDCNAFFWIQRAYKDWSLGVFDSLIIAAIRNDEEFVWDIVDGTIHMERFEILSRLKAGNPLTSDCQNLRNRE